MLLCKKEEFVEKKKVVTQYDVAKEAGVTRSMVSYVITGNMERSVAKETREKILKAIDKLGYRPNKAAQTLQQGLVAVASKRIGVILSSSSMFRRPYYTEIIEGIHIAARNFKYQIDFVHFFEELKDPVLFNELIHEEEIGGIILLSVGDCLKEQEDFNIIERIKERINLISCIEWKYNGLSSIMFDRKGASKGNIEYLFSKGYMPSSYIGELDDRVQGIKLFCKEKNIDFSSISIQSAFDMKGGYSAVEKLCKQNKLTRSILCGSDEVAIGVLCYLNEKSISVPQTVAVISIDNIDMSGYTTPPLTTVNVQKSLLGAKAVEIIVNGSAKKNESAVDIVLPTTIVYRKSC